MSTTFRPSRAFSLSRGFTLVELLVVITIIGVLATLVLLQLGTARAKARDAKRIADINQLRTSMELYFDDRNGTYPEVATAAYLGTYFSSNVLPVDPVTNVAYFYAIDPLAGTCNQPEAGGVTNYAGCPIRFHVWTELERNNSAALRGDADINSAAGGGGAGAGGAWQSGNTYDADTAATTEVCAAAYAAGAARDCIYDLGQR